MFFSTLQAFLTQLVCNLLDEGNAVFRDGDWRQAAAHYSEGVNVARYAQSEALVIPPELLESLYVNRASAHYSLVSGGVFMFFLPIMFFPLKVDDQLNPPLTLQVKKVVYVCF